MSELVTRSLQHLYVAYVTHDPNDGTRGWDSRVGFYLRGLSAVILSGDKEDIDRIVEFIQQQEPNE